jgi:hypothetical protein
MRPARGGSRGIAKKAVPLLDEISEALKADWHGVRVAGRVARHVEILRDVAHKISPDPDRADRPADARQARSRFMAYLRRLQIKAPRDGLGAATGSFVDHLAALARRYGSHLFVCFDDPRIPPTTNELEGFFGEVKRHLRAATGAASTATSVAQNLGPEILVAYHSARTLGERLKHIEIDPAEYARARAQIEEMERPIRRRRSYVRHLEHNLERAFSRWRGSG